MTIYQEKLHQLENRTTRFGIAIISLCRKYQDDILLRSVLTQLIRSSTSIGANYAEANNASSKADFKNKIFIAKKEVGETRYWLNVLKGTTEDKDIPVLEQEALELNLIFQKIISTLKAGKYANEK